jgi:hypothetical protein
MAWAQGLRGQRLHRLHGSLRLAGGHQRLHQRREHRVDPLPFGQPLRHRPFQRQRVAMAHKAGHIGQRRHQRSQGASPGSRPATWRQIAQHRAQPRHHLVAKQRIIAFIKQMAQHRPHRAQHPAGPRQVPAQVVFGRILQPRIGAIVTCKSTLRAQPLNWR